MSTGTVVPAEASGVMRRPRFRFDKRYLAPILVTVVLVVGQVSFGFLESWSRTFLAIVTAIVFELALGRLYFQKWPHLASAYVSGISVGMLVRSPEFWPYALCSAISITSKYVLRVDNRHIWNPSNFGIVAMLVLAADAVGRFHITLTYVLSFLLFSWVRAAWTGHPWLSEVAPITGPMYQLFIFFMITDPRTTVRPIWGQVLVAFLIAALEAVLRIYEFVYAPFYALFILGPAALLIEHALSRRKAGAAVPVPRPVGQG
jgi:hypothetical protein